MNRKKKQVIARISVILLLAALAIFINQYRPHQDTETSDENLRNDIVEVHFIDVGQGDSILIEADNSAMLIDAGENNKGSVVVDYLKSQNIKELYYVIGTHPHSDHIGGLDTVLNSFPVKKVIMPEVSHTTETYEDVLDAVEKNNLTITRPVVGSSYQLGPATFTILAPNSSSYEELNDYSIVLKLTYGNTSFLFTGDAGIASEKEMLKTGLDLSADVLKIGHHGSISSSSKEFLDAVNPSYAMICVGKNNDYGHPHAETLRALKERDIKLYRTDMQGTVVFTSDGKNISVNTDNYIITDNDLDN
jgi:DNA internalization-related competence protein ComEC/Rec2